MITKIKKTIALINSCLMFLSILTFSINANAKISDSASIYIISKLLKKLTPEQGDIDYKYSSEVEEYQISIKVSDRQDLDNRCKCRFSIFKDGTTKIEYFENIYRESKDKRVEEFLRSVNKHSNEFKETLKKIVRSIEFTDKVAPRLQNFVTFDPKLIIKHDGKSNFQEITVTNEGGTN